MEELLTEKCNREKQLETGEEESVNRSKTEGSSGQAATWERKQQRRDGCLTGLQGEGRAARAVQQAAIWKGWAVFG